MGEHVTQKMSHVVEDSINVVWDAVLWREICVWRRLILQKHTRHNVTSLGQASGSPGLRCVRVRDMHISLLQVGKFRMT